MATTLIHNTTLITCPERAPEVLEGYDIVFRGHEIVSVQPSGSLDLRKMDQVVAGERHVVIPGLINTHHHLYQSLTRGHKAVQDATLFTWLKELYRRWEHIDFAAVKAAAKVSIAELLLSGCTTTSDHFYLFPRGQDVRLEAVLEAAEELGIRIHACRGSMTLGESAGGLPPDSCTESDAEVLQDCQRAVELYHDPSPQAMRKIDLAPCAPFNVSHELFVETAKLGRALGVRLHTHAAETVAEQEFCQQHFAMRPLQYLHENGWLGEDVYLAHCVCLNEEEIRLLVDTRTGISHCPSSNMRLGSGVAPISKLVRSGARVGLGVDGSSSNDGGSALYEARLALLLQRVTGGADSMTVPETFAIATRGGAACLGRSTLGYVAPGNCADLAMYRTDDIAFAGAMEQDPLGALLLCHAPRADRVIVHGQTVVEDGRLATADEGELANHLNTIVADRFAW